MSTIKANKLEHISTSDGGIQLDNAGHVTVDGQQLPTAGALSSRNLVVNGAMQVAQRSTSETGITVGGYKTIDRHSTAFSASGAVLTESRSTDSPDGFAYSKKVEVTTAGNSASWLILAYSFEGQDLYSICKGTSAAKPLTLSFWVKADHTANYVVELIDTDNDRIVSYLYTISSANTWQKIEWNIPADTTGAFTLDNAQSLQISWFLAPGSTFSGGTRLTSWGARGSNTNRAEGCNQITNTVGNEFYLTGVQLEIGEKATPFEHKSYGDELQKCKRYFEVFTSGATENIGPAACWGTAAAYCGLRWEVEKRATPTVTLNASQFKIRSGTSDFTCNSGGVNSPTTRGARFNWGTSGTLTNGFAGWIASASASAYIHVDSEI